MNIVQYIYIRDVVSVSHWNCSFLSPPNFVLTSGSQVAIASCSCSELLKIWLSLAACDAWVSKDWVNRALKPCLFGRRYSFLEIFLGRPLGIFMDFLRFSQADLTISRLLAIGAFGLGKPNFLSAMGELYTKQGVSCCVPWKNHWEAITFAKFKTYFCWVTYGDIIINGGTINKWNMNLAQRAYMDESQLVTLKACWNLQPATISLIWWWYSFFCWLGISPYLTVSLQYLQVKF